MLIDGHGMFTLLSNRDTDRAQVKDVRGVQVGVGRGMYSLNRSSLRRRKIFAQIGCDHRFGHLYGPNEIV
jgi:hypothetical protein